MPTEFFSLRCDEGDVGRNVEKVAVLTRQLKTESRFKPARLQFGGRRWLFLNQMKWRRPPLPLTCLGLSWSTLRGEDYVLSTWQAHRLCELNAAVMRRMERMRTRRSSITPSTLPDYKNTDAKPEVGRSFNLHQSRSARGIFLLSSLRRIDLYGEPPGGWPRASLGCGGP